MIISFSISTQKTQSFLYIIHENAKAISIAIEDETDRDLKEEFDEDLT